MIQRDLENLKAALKGQPHEEVFVPAISGPYIYANYPNVYYRTGEEYEQALCDAAREEYRAIVDAGFIVQIDDPRLVTYYMMTPGASVADCRKWVEKRIEAINYSLKGIPPEKVRFHTCYSIDVGPRLYDMELKDIVDLLFRINAGAYSFEMANPRHEHEYHVFEKNRPPEGKILIPGVISHTTNLVEHPELIAERITADRKARRARERHRRRRLRLRRLGHALQRHAPEHRLPQVRGAGGRRAAREPAALEASDEAMPGLLRNRRRYRLSHGRTLDTDLDAMSREELVAEVKKLRAGIRAHRDSTGHDLCWHHPALWSLLPEKTDPLPVVPEWPQFLRGCLRYRESLDEQLPDAPRSASLQRKGVIVMVIGVFALLRCDPVQDQSLITIHESRISG